VRAIPAGEPDDGAASSGTSDVEVAGLTRSDAAGGFETEFAELSSEIMQEVRGAAAAAGQHGGVATAAGPKGE
jgi:hypothetical protein